MEIGSQRTMVSGFTDTAGYYWISQGGVGKLPYPEAGFIICGAARLAPV